MYMACRAETHLLLGKMVYVRQKKRVSRLLLVETQPCRSSLVHLTSNGNTLMGVGSLGGGYL